MTAEPLPQPSLGPHITAIGNGIVLSACAGPGHGNKINCMPILGPYEPTQSKAYGLCIITSCAICVATDLCVLPICLRGRAARLNLGVSCGCRPRDYDHLSYNVHEGFHLLPLGRKSFSLDWPFPYFGIGSKQILRLLPHYDHFRAIYSDSSLHPKIYDTLAHKIFPVLDRRLSKRSLGDLTPPFAQLVFDKLKSFSGKPQVSLKRSLAEALYVSANDMLFGSRFPQDTYEDFFILLDSFPKRLCKRPFWSLPSSRARDRLLQRISDYLEGAKSTTDDKLAASFIAIFREHNIPIKVAAPSVLSVISSLHQNTVNVVFWLFTWLLADPSAFSAVRSEIDKAIREDFGKLQTFIAEATPEKLDSPSFALLNSAVLETMGLASAHTGVRIAETDIDIKDGEKILPMRKGEYVVLDPRGAHLDKNVYPGSNKFVAGRFVQGEYRGDFATTVGYPFLLWEPGSILFLSLYEIKVLTAIYLSLFDVTPVCWGGGSSSTWEPPKPSAESVGTIHPVEDVLVRLRPSTHENPVSHTFGNHHGK
ncbi:cytochrome P450 [Pisolithus marmoratus]|nr:cytochrome P450 [Pisolithus marmoratus]